MFQTILSIIIILAVIGSIIFFIYKYKKCNLTYDMETESPFEKELELKCEGKKIFKSSLHL